MKQSIFKWLSCSLILLVVALSCRKKERGVLEDFPPGKFDVVCIWNMNGEQDTVTGEASGPYLQSMNYYFRVRQTLGYHLKDFKVGEFKKMLGELFQVSHLAISATITYEEHDADHLLVYFKNDNPAFGYQPVNGTFKLTRKY
ncbi:hypothetical protein [Fluviicola sp.]|jgi:hypothetical protein|uniref:hypothetical protein n=1 Tax=Fluviicola sp. TaxID=1917219 RepID=UPI0028331441|nr:hypothetical protein [Fluviicola sp.]MDR0801129.1 hypothetical protein [Fluviicola sp.]